MMIPQRRMWSTWNVYCCDDGRQTGAAEAEAALQSALDKALAPKRLSFGLSLLREPDNARSKRRRFAGWGRVS